MNYKHFTIEERCCLREYYVKGKSYREIARLLGRNVSSVSRELRRNCTFFRDIPRYYPYTAQKKSNLRNSYRHRGMFWKQEVLEYKEKQSAQQLPPPGNVLETGGIGVHRRKAVANVVSRTDRKYTMRDEDTVIQDDISLDR